MVKQTDENRPGVGRRGFLIAAGGAGVGFPMELARAEQPAPAQERVAEVVVVGAGFSGLAAARALAASGRDVLVLEARDRVGGRVVNRSIAGGAMVEAGGTYIGPTQDRMRALTAAYGLATYPTYARGQPVLTPSSGGTVPEIATDFAGLMDQLTNLASEIDPRAPWEAPRAREWDSLTFETWLGANATPAQAELITASGHTLWGAEPREMSLLFVLSYIAAAGNETAPGTMERLAAITGGAQELRLVEGSQALARRIAADLGDRVILSAPVTRIAIDDDGRVVVTGDGVTARARRVITAIPPALAGAIRYAPALPEARAQLFQRRPTGTTVKCQAVYERPFWRERGLSGEVISPLTAPDVMFDNTPEAGAPGVIAAFLGGTAARDWSTRPLEERRARVFAAIAAALGPEGNDAIDYLEVDWSAEEWSRGGPVAYAPPGVLIDYGPEIRRPVGPLHWAGTETSDYWIGYMEGAVRAGERAAEEVIAALG